MHVYLDFDRTLLDTSRAGRELWRTIGQLYSLDWQAEFDRQADFYVYREPGLSEYYYDLAAQLRACGLDPSGVAERLKRSEIADDRLLFPGAAEFVRAVSAVMPTSILTYGDSFYQHLKVALCPAMAELPVHTTTGSKAAWLDGKGECWLVDDKAIGAELPPNVRFIQVQLEDKPVSPAAWPVCTNYTDIERSLRG